eukprot:NODE_4317_length_686_cov_207.370840.p6 GENE.NODE_4317_length_686_cov_207.370840~~NODE_4317_length_686_cov_207.370840.p6  ORF type:complete len:68 (-),score=2.95 NODE_4317_length_686_cov_207.370840:284-487(-)
MLERGAARGRYLLHTMAASAPPRGPTQGSRSATGAAATTPPSDTQALVAKGAVSGPNLPATPMAGNA